MKPAIRCTNCEDGKRCMEHHQYDTSEYVMIPPELERPRVVALEKENKILLEALWHCGIQQKLMTAEAGVRAVVPGRVAEQIDFTKFNALENQKSKSAKASFRCQICGGDVHADDSGSTEWYAGSQLRILGTKLEFRIDKEWAICGKCGDKIHERLQKGEDCD